LTFIFLVTYYTNGKSSEVIEAEETPRLFLPFKPLSEFFYDLFLESIDNLPKSFIYKF
jgi:hypothetical protein